jgi:uroporphyrinogen-III synthase
MRKRAKSSGGKANALSGVRVLVGRARHQASALSGKLRELGATVIEIPFIEIRKPRSFKPLDSALKNLAEYDWLILTSVNGVEAMWERLKSLRFSKKTLKNLSVAAIGPATKLAIEKHGLQVDVVPKEYVAESVVRSLQRRVKGKRVLLVRAKVARDVIPRELRKAGARVDVVEAYETMVPRASRTRLRAALRNPRLRPHVITFTSSSTVRNFVELLGGPRSATRAADALPGRGVRGSIIQSGSAIQRGSAIQLASIGPVTSSTLRELGLSADISAKEFTIPGLVKAITAAQSSERN